MKILSAVEVILFQDVIEVLHRSVLAVLLQNTLVFANGKFLNLSDMKVADHIEAYL